VVAPEATITAAGKDRAALPPDNATEAPPEGAAAINVTVQVVEPLETTEAGMHCRVGPGSGATSVSMADWEEPFIEAVTMAVWSALHCPAVTVNAPLLEPAGIDKAAGDVLMLPVVPRATFMAPDCVGPLRVTVQVVLAQAFIHAGLQPSEATVTLEILETMVAPLAAIGDEVPSPSTASAFVNAMETFEAVGARVKVIEAITPLDIVAEFIPLTMQV
jgi:hypothetical protein